MPFQKGQSGNPSGRPSGRQAYIDRANRYLEDHTVEELMALAKDQHRFGKLCVTDGMIVRRLAVALSKGDGMDMDRILDRVIGKPTLPIATETRDSFADLVMAADRLYREENEKKWHEAGDSSSPHAKK
ncbi:MAG: hypothetical protein EBR02_02810 [Alphaproteobacteria bacterium]|nr:hypothetical protein [Alphaproteobacteria bacterium]